MPWSLCHNRYTGRNTVWMGGSGRLSRAPTPCADAVRDAMRDAMRDAVRDADGLALRCRGLVRGHHRQGLRHRATMSPRHGGRTSASAHPHPTTDALQQATYARLRNGYLVHPIAAGVLGDRTRRTYRMNGIGHAGMANSRGAIRPSSATWGWPCRHGRQTERTGRQACEQIERTERTERTDGQTDRQTDRRTDKRPDRQTKRTGRQTERTDCKYAARRTARILTVLLGVVSDCMYANGSLPRILTVGIQTNPPRT